MTPPRPRKPPRARRYDAAMRVLAIETSCDETAVAVLDAEAGLLGHEVFSQIDLHRLYGGVVPELASRDHVTRLLPMIERVLALATAAAGRRGLAPRQAGAPPVDGVAFTAGPGLIGALLTGAALGRALAFAWGVPAVGVHHLEGHLFAPSLDPDPPPLPHLALLVSGGHTMLIEVEALGRYRLLGETRDDAAGEAFDKSAKLLGLPYPGGPELARLAETGRRDALELPRPMLDRPGLEFSFSGLKTAVRRAVADGAVGAADIAASVQSAIVDTLVAKALRALDATGHGVLVVSGGVSANRALRAGLSAGAERRGVRVYYPRLEFCTDNAAMIAVAGLARLAAGEREPLTIRARAQWPLATLQQP